MRHLRPSVFALLLAHCMAAAACGGGLAGDTMTGEASFDQAWHAVRTATAPDRQRQDIDAFLELNREAGAGPLMVRVRHADTGEKSAIDKALWANPQDYIVTVSYGAREYEFTPLSRASLEPLVHE
jgi:hypothetical protein